MTPYNHTMPQFIKMLKNLSAILEKAQKFADHKKIDSKVLAMARLAPDQFPLSRQVQIACDTAKGCAARMAGQEPPKHEDVEQTLEELRTRIHKTVDYLNTLHADSWNGFEKRLVPIGFMPGKAIASWNFLVEMAIPNFYFHTTVAYEILRHNGVEIGKSDFLGHLDFKDL